MVIVATGRYVGEGLICPDWIYHCVLACPSPGRGTLAQYARPPPRDYAGKQEVIIYVLCGRARPHAGADVPQALSGYARLGYTVIGQPYENRGDGQSVSSTIPIFQLPSEKTFAPPKRRASWSAPTCIWPRQAIFELLAAPGTGGAKGEGLYRAGNLL